MTSVVVAFRLRERLFQKTTKGETGWLTETVTMPPPLPILAAPPVAQAEPEPKLEVPFDEVYVVAVPDAEGVSVME